MTDPKLEELLKIQEMLKASQEVAPNVPLGQGKNLEKLTELASQVQDLEARENVGKYRQKPNVNFKVEGKPQTKDFVLQSGEKNLPVKSSGGELIKGDKFDDSSRALAKVAGGADDAIETTAKLLKERTPLKETLKSGGKKALGALGKVLANPAVAGAMALADVDETQAAELPMTATDSEGNPVHPRTQKLQEILSQGTPELDKILGMDETPVADMISKANQEKDIADGQTLNDLMAREVEEENLADTPASPNSAGEIRTLDEARLNKANKEVENPYTKKKPEAPKTPSKLDELTSIQKQLEALKGDKDGARRKDMYMTLAKGLINAMGHFQAANPNARIGTKAIKQGDMIDNQLFQKRYKQDLGELMDKVKMSQASTKDKELSDYRNRQLDLQEKAMDQRSQESAAERANKLAIAGVKEGQGLSKGQEAADKEFGKSFNEYVTGGKEKTQANIDDLKRARDIIKNNPGIYKGGIDRGIEIIDSPVLRKALNPKAQEVKNLANTVSMQDLKRVLGGQFAEREGKMLMDAAFDPAIGEKESLKALDKLIEKIETAQSGMDKAVNYFEDKGSMVGYKPAAGESISKEAPAQPAQHKEASEAEKWAKANPEDPRAQEILKRLGK